MSIFSEILKPKTTAATGPASVATTVTVLLAARCPRQDLLDQLMGRDDLALREAFTARGVIRGLPGTNLVVMDDVFPAPDAGLEVMQRTLEMSGIPTTNSDGFLADAEEWLAKARLSGTKTITFLPSRQVNLINWSGGVGKTTLSMAICRRFVERTGLPAAMLELSMGGSALHARVSEDLPEFYAIATGHAEPACWNGVHLYPMDGRTIEVLWKDDPERVQDFVAEIRKRHTLFVVDCFPGHPLFEELVKANPATVNLVTTSPRDDAVLQARRLLKEIPGTTYLVLNMAKTLADRAEPGIKVALPYNENWAHSQDKGLADPVLELVYTGWKQWSRGNGLKLKVGKK